MKNTKGKEMITQKPRDQVNQQQVGMVYAVVASECYAIEEFSVLLTLKLKAASGV